MAAGQYTEADWVRYREMEQEVQRIRQEEETRARFGLRLRSGVYPAGRYLI